MASSELRSLLLRIAIVSMSAAATVLTILSWITPLYPYSWEPTAAFARNADPDSALAVRFFGAGATLAASAASICTALEQRPQPWLTTLRWLCLMLLAAALLQLAQTLHVN